MRSAAIAFAWFLSAAARAAAGEPAPAPNAPPFPSPPPAAPAFPALASPPAAAVPSVARAYAPGAVPSAAKPRAEAPRQARGRVCFGQAETRDKIAQRRLADPVRAMRAGRAEGEVLRTRLCRWKGDDLVYEIYALRRDGHVVRLYMNAQNGDAVSAADAAEHR